MVEHEISTRAWKLEYHQLTQLQQTQHIDRVTLHALRCNRGTSTKTFSRDVSRYLEVALAIVRKADMTKSLGRRFCYSLVTAIMLLANQCRTAASGTRISAPAIRKHRHFSRSTVLSMSQKEATVGMGCFWSPQEKFDSMVGVIDSKAGYSGGDNTNPDYKSVCAGDGHIEAVRIQYDDSQMSYDQILDVFFDRDVSAFGNGLGQYQSIIWTETVEQKEIAERRLQALAMNNDPRANLVAIRQREPFYVAETYHQKYNKKQFPRYIVLGIAALLDVLPGLPQEAYKLGLFLTVGYVAVTVGERFVDGTGGLKRLD